MLGQYVSKTSELGYPPDMKLSLSNLPIELHLIICHMLCKHNGDRVSIFRKHDDAHYRVCACKAELASTGHHDCALWTLMETSKYFRSIGRWHHNDRIHHYVCVYQLESYMESTFRSNSGSAWLSVFFDAYSPCRFPVHLMDQLHHQHRHRHHFNFRDVPSSDDEFERCVIIYGLLERLVYKYSSLHHNPLHHNPLHHTIKRLFVDTVGNIQLDTTDIKSMDPKEIAALRTQFQSLITTIWEAARLRITQRRPRQRFLSMKTPAVYIRLLSASNKPGSQSCRSAVEHRHHNAWHKGVMASYIMAIKYDQYSDIFVVIPDKAYCDNPNTMLRQINEKALRSDTDAAVYLQIISSGSGRGPSPT